jgi:hypothetical protein
MQKFQLLPLILRKEEPVVFLVAQSWDIVTIVHKLHELCYGLCIYQYKILACVCMNILIRASALVPDMQTLMPIEFARIAQDCALGCWTHDTSA